MEVWRLSLTISRAFSGYGLTIAGVTVLTVVGQDCLAQTRPGIGSNPYPSANDEAAPGSAADCQQSPLNACAPRPPMKALSAKEVALIMGANAETRPSSSHSDPSGSSFFSSHGSCNAASCHTTATVFQTLLPPITSGAPASDPEGGGGGGHVPDPAQQTHLKHCAQVYGGLGQSPKYAVNFTNQYGFAYVKDGVSVAHATTNGDYLPNYTPPGADGQWLYVSGSTWFDATSPHTDIYVTAYGNDATTVGVLAHEFYHEANDMPGESATQRSQNESNAQAAGDAAKAKYEADNGAQCSS